MARSPLGRVLYPLGLALLASVGVAFFLRDIKPRTGPAKVPHRTPVVVSRFSDAYQVERALGPNGTLYTLLHYERLTAHTPDGRELWYRQLGDKHVHTEGGDAIRGFAVKDVIYATSDGGLLYCVNPPTGVILWRRPVYTEREQQIASGKIRDNLNHPSCSAPVVGPTGNCYILVRHRIVCFGPDGRQHYSCDLREPSERDAYPGLSVTNLQVSYDGTAYVTVGGQERAPDDGLRVVSPEGQLLAKLPLKGWRCDVSPHTDLLLDRVGEMSGGKVIAYDHNWNKQWEAAESPRAVDFDGAGNTYCLTHEGHVVAFDPGGTELWKVVTTADIELSAEGNGPIYTLDQMRGLVTALDRATGKTLWDATPSESDKAAAVEAQAIENGEVAEHKGYGSPETMERNPFGITYLIVDQQGRAYFYGTGNWLFAVGP